MIFPWQMQQWQQLWQAKTAKRLPHALLFSGIPGTGKTQFAEEFSRALLCKENKIDGLSCGACHACRLVDGRSHPNVMWVEPEKAGQAIKVDQIRAVSEFANQSALQGEYVIVIIHPANNMNVNAANALLKTLEEPPGNAVLILLSNQSEKMPATILSRCQKINFPKPATKVGISWLSSQLTDTSANAELLLKLANGAPLAALQLMQEEKMSVRHNFYQNLCAFQAKQIDPLKTAATLQELDCLVVVDFMLSFVMDIARLQLNAEVTDIINQDFTQQLQALAHATPISKVTRMMEYLQVLRNQLGTGLNLNKQLIMEGLMIRWIETLSAARP